MKVGLCAIVGDDAGPLAVSLAKETQWLIYVQVSDDAGVAAVSQLADKEGLLGRLPDNNPLSTDQQAKFPYLTQFLAEPWYGPMLQVTAASGGRVFKAFGAMAVKAREQAWLCTLVAMNGDNGTILWKRALSPGFMIHRNTLVATPTRVYLGDDTSCKVLDAATGELKDEITAPPDNDVEFGARQVPFGAFASPVSCALEQQGPEWNAPIDLVVRPSAMAPATQPGQPMWRKRVEAANVDAIAVAKNAVLLAWLRPASANRSVEALDLTTGKSLWDQRLPARPVDFGLAVDRDGRVLVALRDGRVLCFGPAK